MIFVHYQASDTFILLDFYLLESIPKCKIIQSSFDSWILQLENIIIR